MVDIPIPNRPAGFAIYDPTQGKWSTGGMHVGWTDSPMIWKTLGAVKGSASYQITTTTIFRDGGVVVRRVYENAIVVDMSTNQPVEDFNLWEYTLKKAEGIAKKYSRMYGRDFTVIPRKSWWSDD